MSIHQIMNRYIIMDSLDIFEPSTNQLPSALTFAHSDEQNHSNMQSSRVKILQKDSIIDLLYDYSSQNQMSVNSRKDVRQLQTKHQRSPSIQFIVAEDLQQSQHTAEDTACQNQKKLRKGRQQRQHPTINKSLQHQQKDKSNHVNEALHDANQEKHKVSTTNGSSLQQLSQSQSKTYPKNVIHLYQQPSESQLLGRALSGLDNKAKQSLYQLQIQKASEKLARIKSQNQSLQNTLIYLQTIDKSKPHSIPQNPHQNTFNIQPLKHLLQQIINKI